MGCWTFILKDGRELKVADDTGNHLLMEWNKATFLYIETWEGERFYALSLLQEAILHSRGTVAEDKFLPGGVM